MSKTDDCDLPILIDPSELKVEPPFLGLFPQDSNVLARIEASMRAGYDHSQPIVVWRQKNVVLDGHTRRQAAINVGITDVPVCFKDFDDERKAIDYAIHNQRDRRNLTQSALLTCIKAVDQWFRKSHGAVQGGFRGNQYASTSGNTSFEALPDSDVLPPRKSAEKTADIVGVSRPQVERARSVYDDPQVEAKVLSGEMSIHAGAEEARKKKREKKQKKNEKKLSNRSKVGSNGYALSDLPIPAPEPRKEPRQIIVRSNEEEEWLSGFSIREKVRNGWFDDDALLYREFGIFLNSLRNGRITEIVNPCSPHMKSLLYRELHRLSRVRTIEEWEVCPDCDGHGLNDQGMNCKECSGGGYLIF